MPKRKFLLRSIAGLIVLVFAHHSAIGVSSLSWTTSVCLVAGQHQLTGEQARQLLGAPASAASLKKGTVLVVAVVGLSDSSNKVKLARTQVDMVFSRYEMLVVSEYAGNLMVRSRLRSVELVPKVECPRGENQILLMVEPQFDATPSPATSTKN